MPDLVDGTTIKHLSTPPTTRNKFATFLQRKNEDTGAVVVPGTRSRFFFSSLDSADCVSKKASSQPPDKAAVTSTEGSLTESDCLDSKKLVAANVHNSSDQIPDDVTVTIDEAPPSFETSKVTRTVSTPTLGTPKSCFSWSGSLEDFARTPSPSPSTALQQFRRKSGSACSPPEMTELSAVIQLKSNESGDESHPPHEAGWSSHSQESLELSPHNLNASKLSQLSNKDSDSEVPGLHKSSSVDNLSTTKIKPLVPARVSGLSKKPSNIQKRNHHNAENKPGLQIKINELWKNFGFKKDAEKLPSCKKPEPLSPVKDNIQLTPEAEEDIFNKSECIRVQRAILQ
ncbi:hypothetical protein MC885_001065 [Smutsia gigantea]|nr:hypothetical protein MC885_001065 [Smutsia gigantea]